MKTYKKVFIGTIVGFAIGSVVANPAAVTGEAPAQALTLSAPSQYVPQGTFHADYQLNPSAAEAPAYEYY